MAPQRRFGPYTRYRSAALPPVEKAELAARVAALEKRMNTRQSEYKTDIALLAEATERRERRTLTVNVTLTAAAVDIVAVGLLTRL